jgi:hypothetical protein
MSNFYIIEPETMSQWGYGKTYTTRGRAQSACNKINAKRSTTYVVMSQEEFDAADELVESTNLISGKVFKIRKSQLGGCCDPGTERYWSM